MKNRLWRIQEIISTFSQHVTSNPQRFLMLLFSRFRIIRALFARLYRKNSLKKYEYSSSLFEVLNVEQTVKSLQENGYCFGIYLPEVILKEILRFAYSTEINVDNDPKTKFFFCEKKQAEVDLNQKIIIGNYLNAHSHCSALEKIVRDPKLLAIAARYLDSDPVLIRTQLAWSFVAESEQYKAKGKLGIPLILFHYDLDDFRALKFFFYLTDVDLFSGAHICVRGSHKRRKLIHSFFRGFSEQSIFDYYGRENIVNICGKAGFGFAEDPFCFHRGTPPIGSHRLMLQIEFSLHDYGFWNNK